MKTYNDQGEIKKPAYNKVSKVNNNTQGYGNATPARKDDKPYNYQKKIRNINTK